MEALFVIVFPLVLGVVGWQVTPDLGAGLGIAGIFVALAAVNGWRSL